MRATFWVEILAVLALVGCGEGGGDAEASGGAGPTGGLPSATGGVGTSGGTGGASATGGTAASGATGGGGSPSTGGLAGTEPGGAPATGGAAMGGAATGGAATGGAATGGAATGGASTGGNGTGGTTIDGCGPKPGPDNTGVPPGISLTPSDSLVITEPGTVIDGLDIDGCVRVEAEDVVIRNTRIRCTGYYPLEVASGNLLIEDSEIAASGGIATSGIAFNNYIARRVNVHGAADGMKADSNVLVEASYIHDLWLGPGDHADGVQSTGGADVTFRCNTIDIVDHGAGHGGDPNSCFQVGTEWAPDTNFVIDQNWLSGGGWVINMGGGAEGNRITNNRFTRDYGYGPISVNDTDPTHVWVSGNVWDDTGEPIE